MSFVDVHLGESYSEADEARKRQLEEDEKFLREKKIRPPPPDARSFGTIRNEIAQVAVRHQYNNLSGLDAYQRHKKFINDYVIFYGRDKQYCEPTRPYKTDYDVLREEYRFLRSDEDNDESTFETRLAKKYYDKLFKEYCLADLSRYKTGQVGLRWRTEKEVFAGKGQFACGNKACNVGANLHSYEVNFAYMEAGQRKNALVKLRLCPPCADMLTYHRRKKEKKKEKKDKKEGKHKGKHKEREHEGITPKKRPSEEAQQTDSKKSRIEDESRGTALEEEGAAAAPAVNPWKKKAEVEKTKEEEFEEYFEGLFP